MRGSFPGKDARTRPARAISKTASRVVLLLVALATAAVVAPLIASAGEGHAADAAKPPHTTSLARLRDASSTRAAITPQDRARVVAYVGAQERARAIAFVTAQQRARVLAYVSALAQAQAQSQALANGSHATHRASWAPADGAAGNSTASSSASGGFLACVRNRESRGNYNVVNGGSGTAGAYQFMPSTWNNTARAAGRPDLVGVNPATASPGTQDAMANYLYSTQGRSPWAGDGC